MEAADPGKWGNPLRWSKTPVHITSHVNVIKLKWEIIWTGRLPHLSGLPHSSGFPQLHVNRPLVKQQKKNTQTQSLSFSSFRPQGPFAPGDEKKRRWRGEGLFPQKKISMYLFYCASRSVTIDADQGTPLFQVWMKLLQKNTKHQ